MQINFLSIPNENLMFKAVNVPAMSNTKMEDGTKTLKKKMRNWQPQNKFHFSPTFHSIIKMKADRESLKKNFQGLFRLLKVSAKFFVKITDFLKEQPENTSTKNKRSLVNFVFLRKKKFWLSKSFGATIFLIFEEINFWTHWNFREFFVLV